MCPLSVCLLLLQTTMQASTSTSGKPEEIYIGFKKDEGAAARAGRKGRVIKDDLAKYPSRDFWVSSKRPERCSGGCCCWGAALRPFPG